MRSALRGPTALIGAVVASVVGAMLTSYVVPLVVCSVAIALLRPPIGLGLVAAVLAIDGPVVERVLGIEPTGAIVLRTSFGVVLGLLLTTRRVRLAPPPPVVSLVLVAVVSAVGGATVGAGADVPVSRQLIGLAALAMPWWLVSVRLSAPEAAASLRAVYWLPLVVIMLGLVFWLQGGQTPWRIDAGSFRLQGATAPALLGLLSAGSSVASVVLVGKFGWHRAVGIVPLAIAAATGTRGATAFAASMLIASVLGAVGSKWSSRFLALVTIGAVATMTIFTANERATGFAYGDITSGRVQAWTSYLEAALSRPVFGHGSGATAVLDPGAGVHASFVLPHNEFLHFAIDFGLTGSLVVMLAIGAQVVRTLHQLDLGLPATTVVLFTIFSYAFVDNIFTTYQFLVPFCVALGAVASIAPKGDLNL